MEDKMAAGAFGLATNYGRRPLPSKLLIHLVQHEIFHTLSVQLNRICFIEFYSTA